MCNLDLMNISHEDSVLSQTTTSSSNKILTNRQCCEHTRRNAHLIHILQQCRLLILTDYYKNKPRKIILDVNYDDMQVAKQNNKEIDRLCEMAFGNFNLSSKSDGFKIHIVKSPPEIVLSKVFNVSNTSLIMDLKVYNKRISPDSGRNISPSPSSSTASTFSSVDSNGSFRNLSSLTRSSNKVNILSFNQSRSMALENKKNAMSQSSFGSDNDEYICRKRSIMTAAVLLFPVPEDFRCCFEDYLSQNYLLLESSLNRLSQLILDSGSHYYNYTDNCGVDVMSQNKYHSNRRTSIIELLKEIIDWHVRLLPVDSCKLCSASCSSNSNSISNSGYGSSSTANTTNNGSINRFCSTQLSRLLTDNQRQLYQLLIDSTQYFGKNNQLGFLSEILSMVTSVNPNCQGNIFGFFNRSPQVFYPYFQLLKNFGMSADLESYCKIIIKGLCKTPKPPANSLKDILTTSIRYYKQKLNPDLSGSSFNASDQSNDLMNSIGCYQPIASQQRRVSLQQPNQLSPISHQPIEINCAQSGQDVILLEKLINQLITPSNIISFEFHKIPIASNSLINYQRIIQFDDGRKCIEIPLLDIDAASSNSHIEISPQMINQIQSPMPQVNSLKPIFNMSPLQVQLQTSLLKTSPLFMPHSALATPSPLVSSLHSTNPSLTSDMLIIDCNRTKVELASTMADQPSSVAENTRLEFMHTIINQLYSLGTLPGRWQLIEHLYLQSRIIQLQQKFRLIGHWKKHTIEPLSYHQFESIVRLYGLDGAALDIILSECK